MIPIQYAPFILTAFIGAIILLLVYLFMKSSNSTEKVTEDFLEQLKAATGEEFSQNKILSKKSNNISDKIIYQFGKKFKQAEMVPEDMSAERTAMINLLILAIIYFVATLLAQNFGIGLIPVSITVGMMLLLPSSKIKKKEMIFEDQIPPFLSMLKANIQAGETPERALINAIDETDSPLYDEIKIAKSLTETGSFQVALHTLRQQTTNETLQFLCGCIELSASVGANLEEQIEVIEEMLESKRALQRKLQVAISENKPLVIVSSLFLPGLFMFMYLTNEQTREFWFKNLISWIVFFLVCVIFGAGLYMAQKTIDKTAKF